MTPRERAYSTLTGIPVEYVGHMGSGDATVILKRIELAGLAGGDAELPQALVEAVRAVAHCRKMALDDEIPEVESTTAHRALDHAVKLLAKDVA